MRAVGQERFETIAHNLDDHPLRQRLGLDRGVGCLGAAVVLVDHREIENRVAHLGFSQRQPLPIEIATAHPFKYAAGVGLDVAAGEVPVAEIEHRGRP